MITAEDLYARFPEVLYTGDLRDVPAGWMDIVDRYFQVVSPIMRDTGFEVVCSCGVRRPSSSIAGRNTSGSRS